MGKKACTAMVLGVMGILLGLGVGASGEEFTPGEAIISAVVSVWAGSECMGSGFLISPDGYILTAAHVIEEVRRGQGALMVRLQTGEKPLARVISELRYLPEEGKDVALLKIERAGLPYIRVRSSRERSLGPVTVLGFPAPHERGCECAPDVIPGQLTNLDASCPAEEEGIVFRHLLGIQIPVHIPLSRVQKGLSGGPVLDGSGEAIGLFVAGSEDPMLPYYFASPIDIVIDAIMWEGDVLSGHYLGIRSVTCDETVCPSDVAIEIPADGGVVPLDIGFWSLRGELNSVRVTFLNETMQFASAGDPETDPQGRRFVEVYVGDQAGQEREEYVKLGFVAEEVQERKEVELEISLKTADDSASEPRGCRIILVPCRGVIELATFEGSEGDPNIRADWYLRGWGAFFEPGHAIAMVAPVFDIANRDPRETVIRVDYDVSEEEFPTVPLGDRYCGFWMKWEAVDFSFDDCTHLSLWLRGGDPDERLGYTERVKLELKVNNGWGRYGWRIHYLEGITDRWQQFCVPLDAFGTFGTYRAELNEFVITFEAREVTESQGVLWVDDITFLVPGEECP